MQRDSVSSRRIPSAGGGGLPAARVLLRPAFRTRRRLRVRHCRPGPPWPRPGSRCERRSRVSR